MSLVYIGLGSNLAQPCQQLLTAINALQSLPATHLQQCSQFYLTKPWGNPDQPDFVNAVVAITTTLPALALLSHLQAIEKQQGRQRDNELRWSPRTLDLDILLYDQLCCAEPQLIIPHPRLTQRNFVLYPLAEIAPDLILPDGRAVQQLAAACANTDIACCYPQPLLLFNR